jgi:cyclopropane fatty-acyl-phospholipid synthase-like methyltransferase
MKTVVWPRFFMGLAMIVSGCTALDRGCDTSIADGLVPAYGPEVPYFPTPDPVVDAMLRLAGTGPSDVVYDLGAGDGRIVIAAGTHFGARGVGIEIDPAPLRTAAYDACRAGVTGRVRFVREDIFKADIREATVVTLFLSESVNRRLLPKLLKELKPGTRIVAHRYGFGDAWPPEKTVQAGASTLYLWTVPQRAPSVSEIPSSSRACALTTT